MLIFVSTTSVCSGFIERVRGSHHIFRKDGVRELVNLQRDGRHAKPYQVRQIRRIALRYDLEKGL